MSSSGPVGPSVTGLFRSVWRPRKSIIILWRRVETITPDEYNAIMDWAGTQVDEGFPARWLTSMATNEAPVDASQALNELDALLRRQPPEPAREPLQLLRDLIWEASDPDSDWLNWRPCRVCGRRWAVVAYDGVPLCPLHHTPAALTRHPRDEGSRFAGLADHEARSAPPAGREQGEMVGLDESDASGQVAGWAPPAITSPEPAPPGGEPESPLPGEDS